MADLGHGATICYMRLSRFAALACCLLLSVLAACGGGGGGAADPAAAQPLRITQQPAAVDAQEMTEASFTVAATGSGPLTYQWRRNGQDIPGAVASSYRTPALSLANDQDRFEVTVSDASGRSLGSESAALRIQARALAGLLISEVSACLSPSSQCWFELHNPGAVDVDLSGFRVRSSTYDLGTQTATAQTYALPATVIAAGGYKVLSGNPQQRPQRGSQVIRLDTAGRTPSWGADGFIELLDTQAATVDFVRFGLNTESPTSAWAWSGAAAPALPADLSQAGATLVRPHPITRNSRAGADWVRVGFGTPGGRNDVPANAVDADEDGIPDSAELAGSTFAGLDLHAMGVRTGQVDVLVEVDRMASTDPGLLPRRESLQKVADVFAAQSYKGRPIRIHFDAGNLFAGAASPEHFNLGQADALVPYERCVSVDAPDTCTANLNRAWIQDWKDEFFDVRRRPLFHYLLFAHSSRADGAPSASGAAEQGGNDLAVTMGGWGMSTASESSTHLLINYQAATLMHELGHNFGLDHAGASSLPNHKPNYWSVMNYLYQLRGLGPDPAAASADQRWRHFYGNDSDWCAGLDKPACGPPAQFTINYSNGSSANLDEGRLLESAHLGRGSLSGAYADWDLNGSLSSSALSLDLNKDGFRTVLTDHDDWANLVFPFSRSPKGSNGLARFSVNRSFMLSPMHDDAQKAAREPEPPAAFMDWLKRRSAPLR